MDNLGMKRQILDYVLEGEIRTKEGLNEYLWGRKWEGNFFGPTIRKGWRQEVRDDHSTIWEIRRSQGEGREVGEKHHATCEEKVAAEIAQASVAYGWEISKDGRI